MRSIEPALSAPIQAHVGPDGRVDTAPPYPVSSYEELVRIVAHLAYLNKDHLLFFRGQSKDYRNKAGGSSLYPTIYRDDPLQSWELQHRFNVLESAGKLLAQRFTENRIEGARDVVRRPYVQASILQHYEVCPTPLLDFTHSLWVAASFATLEKNPEAVLYVVALPQLTNRISVNSEHDLVTVRLLSICPPEALRPYFQEGYLAGTHDVTTEYESKTELDFRNRLVAKFSLGSPKFWRGSIRPATKKSLYPPLDQVADICRDIREQAEADILPRQVGEFLKLWNSVEDLLAQSSKSRSDQVPNAARALAILRNQPPFERFVPALEELRMVRNQLVHRPKSLAAQQVEQSTTVLRRTLTALRAAM